MPRIGQEQSLDSGPPELRTAYALERIADALEQLNEGQSESNELLDRIATALEAEAEE